MEAVKTYTIAQVLDQLEMERAWWENVIRANDASAMTSPGIAGQWSFRDVVNHLNVWQQRKIDELTAERDGRKPPAKSWPAEFDMVEDQDDRVDRKNAWFQERDKDQSADDVIATSRNQLARLTELVAETSPQDLNNPFRFRSLQGKSLAGAIMSGSFFEHAHDEHEADISAWAGKDLSASRR